MKTLVMVMYMNRSYIVENLNRNSVILHPISVSKICVGNEGNRISVENKITKANTYKRPIQGQQMSYSIFLHNQQQWYLEDNTA
jgi:hypothetical protein